MGTKLIIGRIRSLANDYYHHIDMRNLLSLEYVGFLVSLEVRVLYMKEKSPRYRMIRWQEHLTVSGWI